MEIFPAIDLRAGRVVRLSQGDYDRQTVYATDPAAVARDFVAAGAAWIHVVDLDAARTGRRANADAVRAVCGAGGRVQLGGGIRDDQAVDDALALGVERVIVGSAALSDWAWLQRLLAREDLAGRVALALDARGGRLAVHGWREAAGEDVLEVAGRAAELPLAAVIYTCIERDGMLTGPDIDTTADVIDRSGLPVIASGGIGSLGDLRRCKAAGCAGAIVGRAYYEGRIDLAAACRQARH